MFKKKLALSVIGITAVFFCLIVLIGLSVSCVLKANNMLNDIKNTRILSKQKALAKVEEKFDSAFAEFDGLFTARGSDFDMPSGGDGYYFTFQGKSGDFFVSCVDFCLYAEKNILDQSSKRDRLYFIYGNSRLYFVYDKVNRIFATNIYLDDYVIPEDFAAEYSIRINVCVEDFTDEQQTQLESIVESHFYKINIIQQGYPLKV